MTKIGIISDTHENWRVIVKAVDMLKARSLDLVIHCGDIVSPPTLERFRGLPMRLIFGNNDGERSGLRKKAEELGLGHVDDFLSLDIDGKKIFVYHGTHKKTLDDSISTGAFDYVLTGHTHVIRDEQIGRTRVINPGALFAAETFTFAVLDVGTGDLEMVEVEE